MNAEKKTLQFESSVMVIKIGVGNQERDGALKQRRTRLVLIDGTPLTRFRHHWPITPYPFMHSRQDPYLESLPKVWRIVFETPAQCRAGQVLVLILDLVLRVYRPGLGRQENTTGQPLVLIRVLVFRSSSRVLALKKLCPTLAHVARRRAG